VEVEEEMMAFLVEQVGQVLVELADLVLLVQEIVEDIVR
jgi:hypothetical protein